MADLGVCDWCLIQTHGVEAVLVFICPYCDEEHVTEICSNDKLIFEERMAADDECWCLFCRNCKSEPDMQELLEKGNLYFVLG